MAWGDSTLRSASTAASMLAGLLPGCGATPLLNAAPNAAGADLKDIVLNQFTQFKDFDKFGCIAATQDQARGGGEGGAAPEDGARGSLHTITQSPPSPNFPPPPFSFLLLCK